MPLLRLPELSPVATQLATILAELVLVTGDLTMVALQLARILSEFLPLGMGTRRVARRTGPVELPRILADLAAVAVELLPITAQLAVVAGDLAAILPQLAMRAILTMRRVLTNLPRACTAPSTGLRGSCRGCGDDERATDEHRLETEHESSGT